MDALTNILRLPPEFSIDTQKLDEATAKLTVTLMCVQAAVNCPVCAQPAARIHSSYERLLADLPCSEWTTLWKLRIRKFFCTNAVCPRRIFAERVPQVAAPWARKTTRLAARLSAIALAVGGAAGSRLLKQLGLRVSRDTLLRAVHRLPLAELPTPRVLGIDDWAHRKGCTYGTILVDLEAHKPVALLADRRVETVAEWLRNHPGVEVISRDRSSAYRQAGEQGAPTAVHVADRFHLLKNLAEALERELATQLRFAFYLPPRP